MEEQGIVCIGGTRNSVVGRAIFRGKLWLLQELEARLTEYLQKGASLEAEFLTAFADLLPTDVRQNLPPQLKDVLFRGTVDKQVPPTPPTRQEVEAVPIATVERNQTGKQPTTLT